MTYDIGSIATPTTTTTARRQRPVFQVSALAGVTAAAVTEVYGAAVRAAGVPMAAAGPGTATANPIPVGMLATSVLICAFWGTVLAVLLARYTTRPARAYVGITAALTALSLATPLSAADTATSTKLVLVFAHLLAAAIIIPVVARRLAHIHRQER